MAVKTGEDETHIHTHTHILSLSLSRKELNEMKREESIGDRQKGKIVSSP